jgi:hypothetical protein
MANIDTAKAFFTAFAATPTANQIANTIVPNLFSPDTPPAPAAPVTPSLGIAGGIQSNANPPLSIGPVDGPQFLGRSAIITCLTQIVTSFPTSIFKTLPVGKPPVYCSSSDGNMIIVTAMLHTGNQAKAKPWFSYGHPAYSKPLSDIEPDGTQTSDVPACAVFTFDTTNPGRILNLAIFMDRWQMAVDLWPSTGQGKHQPRPFPTP